MKKITGHSLLEFMMVCALSLVLLASLLVSYSSMRQNFRFQHALVNMQGHFASWAIVWQRAIRAAGDVSCQSSQDPVNLHDAVRAYSANALPLALVGQVAGDNDVLVVRECVPYQGRLQVRKIAYFIANTNHNNHGFPVLALFQKALATSGGNGGVGQRQELVPGLSKLKLHFLIDNKQLNLKSVNQVADWEKVRAVVADVLWISQQAVLTKPMRYFWQTIKNTAADKRWYQSMQLVTALRMTN